MTSSTDSFQHLTFDMPEDNLGNLEFLAELISPTSESSPISDTSPPSSGYSSACHSAEYFSPTSISPSEIPSPLVPPPFQAPAPYFYYPSPSPADAYYPQPAPQFFFPETFSPSFDPNAFQSSLNSYIHATPSLEQQPQPLKLQAEKSKLKNRRASRSKCPCTKCCHARAHQIPSPTYHACIVKNCQKTYTRPAHLRSHLKSHNNHGDLKCELCSLNFVNSDLLITHMFEHGQQMKL
ncbi:unnamed protein product [Oikopleura dioica]|uniref:C2H2-type domain-containing protein n=1 Tax=Oikopleura dioica TaxID=34765 RepID=E4Y8T8_OIKDI|nr:unnamed protein product [Oikopleura dioica]CBY43669.1 unnamed protein product [Oikopleura dioica]